MIWQGNSRMNDKESSGVSLSSQIQNFVSYDRVGNVRKAVGTTIHVDGLQTAIGDTCRIVSPHNKSEIICEVTGIIDGLSVLSPIGNLDGLSMDALVYKQPVHSGQISADQYLGQVIDCNGVPLEGFSSAEVAPGSRAMLRFQSQPVVNAMARKKITNLFSTGVRAIDSFCACGQGQRIAIISPAGVGKSSLISMIAKGADSDVNVIALVGERGREVREFIEDTLGKEMLAKSVVVVSTAEQAPLMRIQAAKLATQIAEKFRSDGKNVLMLFDSVTRYCRALRDVGLSSGEMPVRRGYPPSVFTSLPVMLERTGASDKGTITAFYTLLADDGVSDPIEEETKSILDGHIYLSSEVASKGTYPAVDISKSISRLFRKIVDDEHYAQAERLRALISCFNESELLITMGEYTEGSDAEIDEAIDVMPMLKSFMRQSPDEVSSFAQTYGEFLSL